MADNRETNLTYYPDSKTIANDYGRAVADLSDLSFDGCAEGEVACSSEQIDRLGYAMAAGPALAQAVEDFLTRLRATQYAVTKPVEESIANVRAELTKARGEGR